MNVFVSGIGLVTPLGSSRESTWAHLVQGRSGIVPTPVGLQAPVIGFSPNGARSRAGDFAILAAQEALIHAGFEPSQIAGEPIGCVVSQSKPILGDISHNIRGLEPELLLSSFFGWSVEAVIKSHFRLAGPTANAAAACATGVLSILIGGTWIEQGFCERVLVGASESSLNPFYRAGFERMGVLTQGRMRPFDENRSGFVMGEGAAVLVLESGDSALRRGHKPLAKILNVGLDHSAIDPVRFDENGTAVARLIRKTMKRDALPGYVNAHGTATLLNDRAESRGLRLAFKEEAARVPVSSTKAATGHLLGAAGAVEAAFCVLALRDQILPPTLNLETPECDLDYVPLKARRAAIESTLSLSYGFGGQMGAILFGIPLVGY